MPAITGLKLRAWQAQPAEVQLTHPSSQRLAPNHEPSRSEDTLSAPEREAHPSRLQHDLRLLCTLRHNPEPLEETQEDGHDPEYDGIKLESWPLERVPGRRKRDIPRLPAIQGAIDCDIAGLQYLEACIAKCLGADRRVHEVGQAIADLDVALDLLVLSRGGIVFVSQAPLIASEDRPGLEHTQDFAVDLRAVWRMAGGLYGIHAVKRGIWER
mmetsp:Transcript_35134/g.100904  ORF Transcript_35134/g.100904 Transcript_35134/m.100904 type:complete len:213 (-) Transcript_35134:650-1288(-)